MKNMDMTDYTEELGGCHCGCEDVFTEACPEPVDVHIQGCVDSFEFDAGDLDMDSLGRILALDVTIQHVCPGRRVALAVILTEVDEHGHEFERGMKTLVIPGHQHDRCRDVLVRCIKFVLPEKLDLKGGTDGICDTRDFRVRFLANYIDSGFDCCGQV